MPKIKYIAISLLLAVLLAGCGENSSNTGTNGSAAAAASTAAPVAAADLAKHNTASDCWMAISGKVYNVTDFVPKHPGGDAILQGCGQDATALFQGAHHSDRAASMLDRFYVADLKS